MISIFYVAVVGEVKNLEILTKANTLLGKNNLLVMRFCERKFFENLPILFSMFPANEL